MPGTFSAFISSFIPAAAEQAWLAINQAGSALDIVEAQRELPAAKTLQTELVARNKRSLQVASYAVRYDADPVNIVIVEDRGLARM